MDVSTPPAASTEPDYRRLLELVNVIVWRADARTFATTFASGEALDTLGYGMRAWTEEPKFWIRHLHPDDRERVLTFSRDEVRAGRTHEFEYRMIAADGRAIWLRNIVTVVMKDGEPSELIGVTTNVNERKRAEFEAAQLRVELARVSRVAAMGELSTLLAHELNQPLGAIVTNAETALLRLKTGRVDARTLSPILEDIRSDAARGGAVVHSVRELIRRGTGRRAPLHIDALIDAVVSFLRSLLGSRGVDVVVQVPAGLPEVNGDGVQLQQVLLNLVVNAVEAMDGVRGTRRLRITARSSGDLVEVTIADTGAGISREVIPRLFEPFVTSKPDGVGIGLSMCQRIISAHGGTIDGVNNADGGATFRFTVPQASGGRP